MNAAIALGLKNWKLIGVAVLVALLGVQSLRLGHAKRDQWDAHPCVKAASCKPMRWKDEARGLFAIAVEAQANLATCKANGATLTAALDRQNAALAAFQTDSASRLAASQKQVQAARAVAASYRMTADAILKAKPGPDVCKSADALISEAVK